MRPLGLALLLAVSLGGAQAPNPGATGNRYFRVGAAQDVRVQPHPGYALMGGGTDQEEAFSWLCDHAAAGDFLVLRAAGTDAYNPWLAKLCKLNSVATLIVPSREAASEPFVGKTIAGASAIFIAGGDQARYISFWARSPVETALRDAVKRGIPIGGTSAGLAVMGQYIYSAQNDPPDGPDLTSEVALADPYARQVVIAPDLLGIPLLQGVITDSHFDTRHREGRLLVFMARILADGKAKTIRGIGVDERTALLVEADGKARVVGKGAVSFYVATRNPRVCKAGTPLTFKAIKELRILPGEAVHLREWNSSPGVFTGGVRGGKVRVSATVN